MLILKPEDSHTVYNFFEDTILMLFASECFHKNEYRFEQFIPNKQNAMIGILNNQPTPIALEIYQTTLSLPISYFHSKVKVYQLLDMMN